MEMVLAATEVVSALAASFPPIPTAEKKAAKLPKTTIHSHSSVSSATSVRSMCTAQFAPSASPRYSAEGAGRVSLSLAGWARESDVVCWQLLD